MNRLLAKKWAPFLFLGIVTLLVWGQTVEFGFVWDDTFFIRDLQSVRSLQHIPEMFYRLDAQSSMPGGFVIFRPIRTGVYALLHFLDGQEVPQPWIYHLANVLWHGAAAMMLFSMLTLLLPCLNRSLTETDARFWAFAVALAFAVHPVVSEVVCWAKSLDDILAAFFTLAMLRGLLLSGSDKPVSWRTILFFVLAVYSKESAVPLAILPLVIFRKIHFLGWKDSVWRTLPFLAVALIYLVHRRWVIGRTSQTEPISGSYAQTLVDMLPVVPEYIRLLCGVPPFSIDYSYMHGGHPLSSAEVLCGLGLLALLVAAAVVSWRTEKSKAIGFGLLWTGLFLLPVSNLVPMMQYMAERFLYLPLIGWLIALAGVLSLFSSQKMARATTMGLIFLWAITAWNRSWIWRDEVTLFVRSSQEGPKTQRIENNAVHAILDLPSVRQIFISKGAGLEDSVRPVQDHAVNAAAVASLAEAYRLFPQNPDLLSHYGIALAATGDPEQALPFLTEAARLEPEKLVRWLNLAHAAMDAGHPNLAEPALQKAGALASDNPDFMQLEFKYYWMTGNFAAAREVMQKLNAIVPTREHADWLSEAERQLKLRGHPTNAVPVSAK